MFGMSMKPRRPRAVVLCPTRELTEQVSHDFKKFVIITIWFGMLVVVHAKIANYSNYRSIVLQSQSVIMHVSDQQWLVEAPA
jgi:superfamily II DNA or RNA helicase